MSLEGRLYRCPSCIAPLPREQGEDGPEFILDPEGNVCPNCQHVFSAAAVLEEDYPRRGVRGPARGTSPRTGRTGPKVEPQSQQRALFP